MSMDQESGPILLDQDCTRLNFLYFENHHWNGLRKFLLFQCDYFNCCNLSSGIALNVWFATNEMCTKKNTTFMWREQAIIEWSRHMNSIVACCHSAKLCTHATWAFPIATKWCCDQDVKVVLCEVFTKRTCDRCGSLWKGGDVVAASPLVLRWMCDSARKGCARRTTMRGVNKQ